MSALDAGQCPPAPIIIRPSPNMTHLLPRALIALSLSVAAHADVLLGPVRNQANGQDYYLLAPTSWLGAEIEAQRLDGHLAVIESAAENQWIADTFRSLAPRFWIGYSDALVEGEFRTVDGRPTTFKNFARNQPDNIRNEDYVEMLTGTPTLDNGVWNDRNEVTVLHALVKVAPLPDVLAGPIRNPANGSSYYLLSDSFWHRAQAKARALGGNLATVSSEEENAWILSTFGNWAAPQPVLLWVGYTDEGQEGSFHWISGEANRYSNWRGGEPNNGLDGEHYVHLWPDGTWNDYGAHAPVGIQHLRLGVVEIDRPVLDVRVTEVELKWNARFGKLYQVQESLGAGSEWVDSGQPHLGKDSFLTIKVPVPAESPSRLFRVVELP